MREIFQFRVLEKIEGENEERSTAVILSLFNKETHEKLFLFFENKISIIAFVAIILKCNFLLTTTLSQQHNGKNAKNYKKYIFKYIK